MRAMGRTKLDAIIWAAVCVLIAGGLVACQPSGSSSHPDLSPQVAQLEKQVADLSAMLDEVRRKANTTSSVVEFKANAHPTAVFDPADPGFQLLDTGVVTLAISVDDVKPLADGSRVTFHFGNPSSAAVNDLKLQLTYGQRLENFKTFSEWDSALLTAEKKLTVAVQPGSWNPQQITLPRIRPENLGYIKMSAHAAVISLSNR